MHRVARRLQAVDQPVPVEGGLHGDGFQPRAIHFERLQDRRQLGEQAATVDRLALLGNGATERIAFVQVQACV
jgi:hypothetical protein